MIYKILVLVVNVTFLACTGCGGDDSRTAGSDKRGSLTPTADQIANLTVTGIYDEPVTLVEGRYEGEPFVPDGASRPAVEWADGLYGTSDLTGDGIDDAAILLVETSGGSGTRLYVAVVSIRDGEPVNTGTAFVGDRPQVRSMKIVDGGIWLEVVQQGPDDAACCPTQLARRAWKLNNGVLEEVVSEITGSLSLEIFSDTEWVATHFNFGEPAPVKPEITLVFEEKKISGSAGCNHYFAAIEEISPGEVRLGPVGSTRKSCDEAVDQIEYMYYLRAARFTSYSFLLGRLALSWRSPDGWHGTMLFSPRPPTPPVP